METNKKDVLQDLSNIVSWLKEKAKNFSIKSVASKTLSSNSRQSWKYYDLKINTKDYMIFQ